ncbi:hypothetical protein WH52_11665 [Tenacibaculum holothuriorum]|uniref:Uncharacterized protein n=1 Tax=Tenacibaculum holothuriorum TaxID=1635173 RepID=A0A1Y2PBB8_9FLAO|nr:hypothetical protein [Tenacibaculum holothuriorum]OSY87301.1 hypothetical protein WH52_11665 [Tenacibaculum holothuriorum]
MSFKKKQRKRESSVWWSEKRSEYNFGLFLSGIFAFILYALVVEFIVFKSDKVNSSEIEITLFHIFFQGMSYLVMMGFANIIYYGISGTELLSKKENVLEIRIKIYKTFFWISCGIPFLIPLFLFFYYI